MRLSGDKHLGTAKALGHAFRFGYVNRFLQRWEVVALFPSETAKT